MILSAEVCTDRRDLFFETDIFAIDNNKIGGDESKKKRCGAVDVPSSAA